MGKRVRLIGGIAATLVVIIVIVMLWLRKSQGADSSFLNISSPWVDALMNQLNKEQKAGQMILVELNCSDTIIRDSVKYWIEHDNIGGIILKNCKPTDYSKLIPYLQKFSKVPLFIGKEINYEDLTQDEPNPLTIGAISDTLILSRYAKWISSDYKMQGFNFFFCPVFNIPGKSTSDFAIYGDKQKERLEKLTPVFKAFQQQHILAVAGNFS
jgi:hypothetical protein